MNNSSDKHSAAVKKRLILVILCVAFLLLAAAACVWLLKEAHDSQRKRKEYGEIFEVYAPFGLLYSEKENRLYYGDELVRYFEDIISTGHYLKWSDQDGTTAVYAKRNAAGGLVSITPFSQQEFSDRTSSLKTAGKDLEITINIDGDTYDMETMADLDTDLDTMIKERISEEYEIYRQYGLTYDMDSDRLYYDGELVGYFEDEEIKHYFGPFEDSAIKIYAIRDGNGDLSGLDVGGMP